MEQKTIAFDLSEDRLAQLADKKFEEGDTRAGLRILNKQIDLYGAGADEYMALADAYDDLGLFDLSADNWFRFFLIHFISSLESFYIIIISLI